MSKVICDICGTVYQDTAECCPICGYSEISGFEKIKDEVPEEEILITRNKNGRFTETSAKKKHKEIFDYDEVNADEEDEEEVYEAEEEYEEEPRSNSFVIVLLVILIMLLLAATGFVFFRFLLPNLSGPDAPEQVAVATEATEFTTEATTEPTIPCQSIVLTEGMEPLTREGQYRLLNVVVMPEDTTDVLTYTSGDESIATVSENGRITAVSEGETTVYITCGKQQINCPVVVQYVEETEPATEETAGNELVSDETVPSETEAETAATELVDVELKLKKYDITLPVGYGDQLELDCDLDASDVKWYVLHGDIAVVNDQGFVTAIGYGTTAVVVEYGDQQVKCIVRCK